MTEGSMKLGKLYDAAVKHGMEVDPRGKARVSKGLKKARKKYDELRDGEKERFDLESLTNPYPDTRILYGDENADVKHALVGIDMEVPELLLADRLREKGEALDLVWAHHPEGSALANLGGVMAMQADILSAYGVPINVAEGILEPRIKQVDRTLMPINHMRAVDAARLLDIPMMCTHTPADNCVTDYLTKLFNRKKPETVGDVLDVLRAIPEYEEAEKCGMALKVFAGSKDRRAGRIFVDMTGGTGGSEQAFEKLANTSDIGTIVGMHIGEKHREEAEKNHINIVIAGHMASDTLGMNLLIDAAEKAAKKKLKITHCSGFVRHKH